MNRQLLEIENKIESHLRAILDLQTLKLEIIQSDVSLYFDDTEKTIRWNNGNIKLANKPYLFVKTLWASKESAVSLDEIEVSVWNVGTEEKPFVEKHTFLTLVARAQKQLEKAGFPYQIEPVKNFSTQELQGYKLVSTLRTKFCYR